MRKTICVLVAACGLTGCGNDTPNYEFSGEIEGNKVTYKVPNFGLEYLTVTGNDKVTKEYSFGGGFDGEDTSDFLNSKIDLLKVCVTKGESENCFRVGGGYSDKSTYPDVFKVANEQARYWINRILEVKRAKALNLVKEAEKK